MLLPVFHFVPFATLVAAALGAGPATDNRSAKCERSASELVLNTAQSTVRWKGTKFLGLGKHEGTVRFAGGVICVRSGEVQHGWFEVDLRTIEVTDIPAHEPVPRQRLRNHLLGEDFFHVAAHPTATFIMRHAIREKEGLYRIAGTLSIRGRTHPITFYARVSTLSPTSLQAEARVEIDRQRYGVSYRGSTLRDDLVDDRFQLDLAIVAQARQLGS